MKKFTLLAASCLMALAAAAQTSYVTPATDIESGDPTFDFKGTTNYVFSMLQKTRLTHWAKPKS